ncbi:hypothetical protein TRL7639_00998 [Falsiruegeria litorea R37]|uniref:HEAT repeat domain-containing protein n=1 Tax=Falsiruegeria litorea R37 TaxID=1200284 RepID=A0A1Y5RY28_9RHOB|nr:hypothetical protein [Falsiruegeria litorea]SLN27043.1 hypothetical protein TRL7639_00998 [Falsiruegeria litorea R37]
MFRRSVSLAAVSALFASQAWACAFHGYNPQITFVERLLGSEHIVLARPSEARPFRYSDIEVLEGTADYVDIPHLVDSIARRRLAANPDDHILFARDGAYGPWQRIAYVNPAMQDVLDVVMAELPEWEMGADEERFAYFASLLNHPDKEVHALALRELDLADYSILRQLVLDVDPQRLISRLGLQSETDLRPIRVLLLGLSGARIDQAFFENGVAKSSDYSGGMLGALAMAMVEHGGSEAALRLVNDHLLGRDLSQDSREQLVEVLAIHGTVGDEKMRETVQAALGQALRQDPGLVAMAARQLGARWDWSQSELVSELMRSGKIKSPLDMLVATQYVALAQESADLVQN